MVSVSLPLWWHLVTTYLTHCTCQKKLGAVHRTAPKNFDRCSVALHLSLCTWICNSKIVYYTILQSAAVSH